MTIHWMILTAASVLFNRNFAVPDTTGGVHTPSEWHGHSAIVLFFVHPECPLSNSYVPELNRIYQEYAKRGVLTYAVQTDSEMTSAAAAAYVRDYRYDFPLLLDSRHDLVLLAGARITPQAAILSAEGKVLYLGRIDNRVEDLGSRRTRITSTDLRDALDAVLAGKPVAHPLTKSIGCAIPQSK